VENYVTIDEAAKRLGKTVEEVRAMMNANQLRGIMSSGTFKFKESDIAALVAKAGPAASPAGGGAKEDTLMTIDADVLFAEGESNQPADAAAETWIAADMENVFESENFNVEPMGEEPLGRASGPEAAMGAKELQPAPLPLSRESDDTSLGAVLMEGEGEGGQAGVEGLGDEPVIAIDPESGIATITAPTPGISRTHMIVVSEPEPRHKAFTPLLVVATAAAALALMAVGSAVMGVMPQYLETLEKNLAALLGGAFGVALIAAIVGLILDKQKAASEAAAARMRRS
jgi:excisionase family DNA binding protein